MSTQPDMPHFHRQIDECHAELATSVNWRAPPISAFLFTLTPIPSPIRPDPEVAQRSQRKLLALAEILDGMGWAAKRWSSLHVGGLFGDKEAALHRFVQYDANAPASVRRRLALENDDRLFTFADAWRIHQATGIPLVLDRLHFLLNNPEQLPMAEALSLALVHLADGRHAQDAL